MAVIKILGNSKSFNGVDYNEERVSNGEAELVTIKNFDGLFDYSKNSLKGYLELWSQKNSRIKNPQLHFTISVKGQEMDKENLSRIAEEWLNKMGYGKCPYLIYFHNNTHNNHIHIVTTRVGEDGRKIDHNFERMRAVQVLNQIEGIKNINIERKKVAALLRYSFSTRNQLIELFKAHNFTVKEDNDGLTLWKNGCTINISNNLFEFCKNRYHKEPENNRKKEIQAKIFKYAKQLDRSNFVHFMRDKFGLQFIFYGKNNSINGYTIIDYNNKSIYKGSEIFSLKKINELLNAEKSSIKNAEFIINDYLSERRRATIEDINALLAAYGMKTDGRMFFDNQGKRIGECSLKTSSKILNAVRLDNVMRKFGPVREVEKKILADMFGLKMSDMKENVSVDMPLNKEYYYNFIMECREQGLNIRDELKDQGVIIHRIKGEWVIVDETNEVIAAIDRVGISNHEMDELMRLQNHINIGNGEFREYSDSNYEEYSEKEWEKDSWKSLVEFIGGLLNVGSYGAGDSYKHKKKKR